MASMVRGVGSVESILFLVARNGEIRRSNPRLSASLFHLTLSVAGIYDGQPTTTSLEVLR